MNNQGVWMRLSGKIALIIGSFLLVILTLLLFSLNRMLGTPENVQVTATKMLKVPEIAVGVAGLLIDQLLREVPPQLVVIIEGQRNTLAQAASQTVIDSSATLGAAAGTISRAFINNESTTINLYDVLNDEVAALHLMNPVIPAELGSPNAGTINISSDSSADHIKQVALVNNVKTLLNLWWVLFILCLALFFGISRLDKRTKFGALRWPGFITTFAAAIVIAAGYVIPRVASFNMESNQQEIANSVIKVLASGLISPAFMVLIVGISLVTASFVIKDKT